MESWDITERYRFVTLFGKWDHSFQEIIPAKYQMTTSPVKDNIITKQFLPLRYASIVLYFWLRNAPGRGFSAVEVLIKLVVPQALAFDHNCEEIEVESS